MDILRITLVGSLILCGFYLARLTKCYLKRHKHPQSWWIGWKKEFGKRALRSAAAVVVLVFLGLGLYGPAFFQLGS